jgi:hypothetical protein
MDKLAPPRSSNGLTVLGLALTFVYLAGAAVIIAHGDVSLAALKANELADFLAGVFAPLAFLWLVLGFFLQRQELSHSSAALWLQSEELAKSVEHQRELAEQTRRQVDAELQAAKRAMDEAEARAQPLLIGTNGGAYSGDLVVMTFRLRNAGPTCSNVAVHVDDKICGRIDVLTQSETLTFEVRWEHWADMADVEGVVTYVDGRGVPMGREFVSTLKPNAGPNERHSLANMTFSPAVLKNYLR